MDNVCNTIKSYFYKKLFILIEKTQYEIDDTDIDDMMNDEHHQFVTSGEHLHRGDLN